MKNLTAIIITFVLIFLGQNTQAQHVLTPEQSTFSLPQKILKVDLVSPVFLHLEFAYEHMVSRQKSIETQFSLIGIGTPIQGFSAGIGYRYYVLPNTEPTLKGLYLQPTIKFGTYRDDEYRDGLKVNYQALMMNTGWQFLIGKHIAIDCTFGLGVANDNVPITSEDEWFYMGEIHYGIYKINTGVSLATTGGIKVGFAF